MKKLQIIVVVFALLIGINGGYAGHYYSTQYRDLENKYIETAIKNQDLTAFILNKDEDFNVSNLPETQAKVENVNNENAYFYANQPKTEVTVKEEKGKSKENILVIMPDCNLAVIKKLNSYEKVTVAECFGNYFCQINPEYELLKNTNIIKNNNDKIAFGMDFNSVISLKDVAHCFSK